MRTSWGIEKMPRLPRFPTLARIEAALRDHPLRTPYGVEKMPRLVHLDDRAHTYWVCDAAHLPRLPRRVNIARMALLSYVVCVSCV